MIDFCALLLIIKLGKGDFKSRFVIHQKGIFMVAH